MGEATKKVACYTGIDSMSDSMSIEQSGRLSFAEAASQPKYINLETFYQNEVDRYKTEQARVYEKAWETIEKAANKNSPKPQLQEQERKPRQPSIADKVRRQALLMQARLEGVKDLSKLEELVDYFEYLDESDSKGITVPKGLSDDQKKEILTQWSAKGWDGDVSSFHNKDKRHDEIYLHGTTPLRLGREHVRFIKNLVSSDNNPVELAEELRKMGFSFYSSRLKDSDQMEKLGQFFNAPHAQEALEVAQGISRWRHDGWFPKKGDYFARLVEVGQIDFLTQLAQNEDPKSALHPEIIDKIDTLSRAVSINVGATEINELQTILNNPAYLEFTAYLLEANEHRSFRVGNTRILDNIAALDKAGVLTPTLTLYHSGISLDNRPYSLSTASRELLYIFDDSQARDYPHESQQKAVKFLQEHLEQTGVKEFLQDPQKQEFTGLLADLTGNPLPINQVSGLEKLFGEGLNRKKEAIYALRFMQANGVQRYSYDLERLGRMALNQHLMETLTNQDFSVFLQNLKHKTSYSLTSNDLCDSKGKSRLVEIFDNPELKQGLIQDSTSAIIKAKHPDGNLDLSRSEYYIQLAKNPNMIDTINTLRELGYNISDESLPVEDLEGIANNPDTLSRLRSSELNNLLKSLGSYNYKFKIEDIQHLILLSESSDKEYILRGLGLLKDNNLGISYYPRLSEYYAKLTQIPGIEDKLKEAGTSITKDDLVGNNLKLFVTLDADSGLYNHARKLLSDDYFKNIRDARNRLFQFESSMYSGEISEPAIARIFAVSQKATELDRLSLKLGINSEIARTAGKEDWHSPLLQASNFQEANEELTKLMTQLALPVVYSDLQGEELARKENELVELADRNKEFDDVLEICCRSVGIYGKKYPSKGSEFATLMGAVKQSLELNLGSSNPREYLQKRAELSNHQFDRIFEGFSQDIRDRVMRAWLDLSSKRRLRVSSKVVAAEEATLDRLNRIRDIVRTDLSVHLQELFLTKIKELEQASKRGVNGPGTEQLAIYKQYLLTPEGAVRQDTPRMYRSVETFIHNAQAALRNPETPKEEKSSLGKSLGTYQAISDSLKALYRLGTVSGERYKARRDYLNEHNKHIGEFSSGLKRLRILDPERRSEDVNIRALEEEVLLDFGKLTGTMAEEGIEGQVTFETESTVSFRDLARAPAMTQSCQRLTEVTGYNQAAYSRVLDANNEMIDIYEMRNGERNRLARSFVELSKIRLTGEKRPNLAVLIDREYVNPQYQNFSYQFSSEIMLHMLDRISKAPELSLFFDSNRFGANPEVSEVLGSRGYRLRQVSGEYFVNESNVKLQKYYDSMGGLVNVTQPSYKQFNNFYLIEKI